jgi:hypothetical protein
MISQWHLDLTVLGALTAAAPKFVPDLPRKVVVPLAVGAWVNGYAFGVLAFRRSSSTTAWLEQR